MTNKCTGNYKNGKPCKNNAKENGRCGKHPLPTVEPKLDNDIIPSNPDGSFGVSHFVPDRSENGEGYVPTTYNKTTIKSMSTVKQPKRKTKKPELIVIDDVLPINDRVFEDVVIVDNMKVGGTDIKDGDIFSVNKNIIKESEEIIKLIDKDALRKKGLRPPITKEQVDILNSSPIIKTAIKERIEYTPYKKVPWWKRLFRKS